MKTKPLTIILLVAVVLIWAWIMYSVFDYMDDPAIAAVKKRKIEHLVNNDTLVEDYILALNYKDPFLKKEYFSLKSEYKTSNNGFQASATIQKSSSASKQVKGGVPKEEIPIPVVNYVGRIQNAKLKKPIAILVISNHEYMMQEGEENEGILLKQIMNDSVQVVFSKKMFYVKKY